MKSTLMLIIAGLALFYSVRAAPPTREAMEIMKRSGTWERWQAIYAEARQRGVDAPGPNPLERLRALRRDDADQIRMRLPVILTDFEDNPANQDAHTRASYERQLFGLGEYTMRDAYLENSYYEVDVQGEVFGWVRMERPYSYYVGDNYGLGGGGQQLAFDAVRAVDEQVDFSTFDEDGDGVVQAVMIIHAGIGAEISGSANDMWSHAGWSGGAADSIRFNRFSVNPETGLGVYLHEQGHSLFNLPDLYGTDTLVGLGNWSMMATGVRNHLDAWCKAQLGWVQPIQVTHNLRELRIAPVEIQPQVYQVACTGGGGYFLIENRQFIRWDQNIPGAGLIIYHVGGPHRNGENLAVEEADGLRELERGANRGDAGDPFPGTSNNRTFDDRSNPNSRGNPNWPSQISITEIRLEGQYIACNILNGIDGQNLIVDSMRLTPVRLLAGRQINIIYRIRNAGNITSDATVTRLWLSRDTRRSNEDIVLGEDQPEDRLAPNGRAIRMMDRLIPGDTDPGAYYVLAVADPDSQVVELVENDNLAYARVMVGGEPNLCWQDFSVSPAFIRPGQALSLFYRILNNGGAATGEFTLDFYVSRDSLRTNDDLALGGVQNENALSPGEFVERQLERNLPQQVLPGYIYALVVIDRQNHVREIDETDNLGYAQFTVPGPNLKTSEAAVSSDYLRPGDETVIELRTTNCGLIDAPPSALGFALSQDAVLSNDDRMLGDFPALDAIALGDTLETTVRRTVPPNVVNGDWFILIKSDCFGRIPEMDEEDNVFALPVTIHGSGIEYADNLTPGSICLFTPYPNPANSEVKIDIVLPSAQFIDLRIENLRGEVVAVIASDAYSAGLRQFYWQARLYPAGIYFVRLKSNTNTLGRKIVILK